MVHGASLDTRLAPSLDSRERRPLTFVASNGKDVAATGGADSNFKQVANFLQAHLRHEVAPAGHNLEEMLVMQAVAGFAEGRASDLIALHDFFFR